MANFTLFALLCLSCALHAASAQQRIRWENNGQLFSLLSTGSRYRAPLQRGGHGRLSKASHATVPSSGGAHPRSPLRVFLLSSDRRQEQQQQQRPVATAKLTSSRGSHPGSSGHVADGVTLYEFSGGGRAAPSHTAERLAWARPAGGTVAQLANDGDHDVQYDTWEPLSASDSGSEDATGGAPRRSENSSSNSVLHDLYPPATRRRPAPAAPPRVSGQGHGTRFFHHGLPDLVPDPYYIQAATYVQHVQMYALRCAAEENCLAKSAYERNMGDLDYRVLLRFPQRVKNQGTADFLPVKPKHQWEWHSCHQHYHSMDAFSLYELLDTSTEKQVAEGHKASFCLEDTTCDPGVRRRYACTAHTQGLGPGCYDTYHANIDCQWIDITDVPPGNYVLKVTVNPTFQVQESDFSNNMVRCDITYTSSHVQTHNCRITSS